MQKHPIIPTSRHALSTDVRLANVKSGMLKELIQTMLELFGRMLGDSASAFKRLSIWNLTEGTQIYVGAGYPERLIPGLHLVITKAKLKFSSFQGKRW